MILMENDCIPVNRKILYNDSLNCKEKIALIILLDTEAGSISYDHLAKKNGRYQTNCNCNNQKP